MTRINGDIIPASSGIAHLGVNGGRGDSFDIASLAPFGHIHLNSGVFHDPMTGQSGVMRYSQAAAAFEVSIDGGWTFNSIATSSSSDGSGLNAINGDRGPNIDLIGVSGIQVVPQGNGTIYIGTSGEFITSQSGVLGVNGITVHQIGGNFVIDGSSISGINTPSSGIQSVNGEIGPAITIDGVNGVTVSVTGPNTITINAASLSGQMTPDGSGLNSVNGQVGPDIELIGIDGIFVIPSSTGVSDVFIGVDTSGVLNSRKYVEAFTTLTNYALGTFRTFTHNLGTFDVLVQIFDTSLPNGKLIMPDDIVIEDENSITVYYNAQTAGRVVIIG
jgi:hypothetical protein